VSTVQIEQIVFDAGTQVRAAINEDVVSQYAERMDAGDVFPPVVVFHDGNNYYLGDGFHRALAAKRNGLSELPADVRGGTKTDALWFALGANRANGQRLTTDDKRNAIYLALQAWPDKSNSIIAEQIGCSPMYVSTIKSGLATTLDLPDRVIGRDGHSYAASPAARRQAREDAARLLSEGKSREEVRRELKIGRDTINEIARANGVGVDKSKSAVAQRRKDIGDMAARGFTTRQIAATLGLSEPGVAAIARSEGINIHADRAVGNTHRHDSNRIVAQTVMDATNLTADINLVNFDELDRSQVNGWIAELEDARKSLGSFIRRLKEIATDEAA
jgi:DNA-binding CsgD family transcriptional regulator